MKMGSGFPASFPATPGQAGRFRRESSRVLGRGWTHWTAMKRVSLRVLLLAVALIMIFGVARITAQEDAAASSSPLPSSSAPAKPVDFKAILAWAVKTGAKTYKQGGDPVVIHKQYVADMGLGDGIKDIPAIQKAFGNSKVSLALYVPLDDKFDVVVDFKDADHEVAWRVRRSGIVVQTRDSDGNAV